MSVGRGQTREVVAVSRVLTAVRASLLFRSDSRRAVDVGVAVDLGGSCRAASVAVATRVRQRVILRPSLRLSPQRSQTTRSRSLRHVRRTTS